MKKISILLLAFLLLTPIAKADEGMWFLMFIERLNQRDMQKLGLQLTAQEIYSINNNSLKDANFLILSFPNFLIFTALLAFLVLSVLFPIFAP